MMLEPFTITRFNPFYFSTKKFIVIFALIHLHVYTLKPFWVTTVLIQSDQELLNLLVTMKI
jgi:hypothetical protein